MRSHQARALGAFMAIACLALAGSAQAISIQYNVGGVGPMHFPGPVTPPANAPWGPNGYPGDTVEFGSYTGWLNLTPGSVTQKINTLLWTIDYTYAGTATDPDAWSDLAFDFDAVRNIDLGLGGSLSQSGHLDVTWFFDALSLSDGLTSSYFAQGYQIDVTPLGLAPVESGNLGDQGPRDVMARFDISEVPEPTTMLAGSLALALYSAAKLRRNRRKHTT